MSMNFLIDLGDRPIEKGICPNDKWNRYISVHVDSIDDFIPNAKSVSEGKFSEGNYHAEMNRTKFEK